MTARATPTSCCWPPDSWFGYRSFLPTIWKRSRMSADHALAILPADVAIRERNLQVLVHRQVVEQVIALKHEADVLLVQFRALLRIQTMDRLIHEVVLAGPRAVVHAEDVEQRRLAGARRPHDRDELALLDVDVHAPQHVGAADAVRVGLFDVPQRNQHGYSVLSATIGSTRVARRAGRYAARSSTVMSVAQTRRRRSPDRWP